MKKYPIILFCIILACSKDVDLSPEVNNTTQESPTENSNNQNTNTPTPFTSRSERYSSINETTGYFNNQNNFHKYTTDSLARSLAYRNDEPCKDYIFSTSDQVTYDFNGDGYLDSVSFLYHGGGPCDGFVGDGPNSGYNPGVFAVYNDFFFERTVQYFETDLRWVAGDWELNDIDGDGDFEIIVWSFNRHENFDFPLKDISILNIDSNLNLVERQLEFTGYDFHNGSSGDLDNDGDVDLIKWGIDFRSQELSDRFPKVLLNDGLGNFIEEPLLDNQPELESDYPGGWEVTVNDLFDINGDGFLDIVVGYDFGNFNSKVAPLSDKLNDFFGEIVILWGSSTGKFNSNNISIITDSNYLNTIQIYLGTSFTDYDSDGDIDIITSSTTNNYQNFIVNIFQNNGDLTFTDVTENDCDICFDNGENFSHFYRFHSIDIDNDGDYDLVPGDVNSWKWDFVNNQFAESLDNLYWENIGGQFKMRKEN